jgi:hypothetical protein
MNIEMCMVPVVFPLLCPTTVAVLSFSAFKTDRVNMSFLQHTTTVLFPGRNFRELFKKSLLKKS